METIIYIAPDISCEHCQRAIEGALGDLPGVSQVQVDIPSKRVEVRFDPTSIDSARLEAALEEEGYPVSH
ncbi:MAG TPA: heavy-metal-associated domain-containing protein [Chloroflexota bacterium]|nr:heavy-metal-associated domain-containing protein [Chloroflexota bacterium]